ncbi:MAG: saccharopine dehydrogenase, partial [Planctomycetota bacterium]
APDDAIILGLKELEVGTGRLRRTHIHFAHVYKNQSGWEQFLSRFERPGKLYDLEFLVDDRGRRIAAFGHWAGFAGAAVALMAWCRHKNRQQPVLERITSRSDQSELVGELKNNLDEHSVNPKAMVIGAKGRCGRGAIELFESVGCEVLKWDLEETEQGGPFPEILDCDIFLNCVFIDRPVAPFLNRDLLGSAGRVLSVVCDVSCDPYGDYNPVPIYDRCTTFDDPTVTIVDGENPLYLIAIDHLPSLLPKESSEDFCKQLLPFLYQLDDLDRGVWKRANDLFESKLSLIGTGI